MKVLSFLLKEILENMQHFFHSVDSLPIYYASIVPLVKVFYYVFLHSISLFLRFFIRIFAVGILLSFY
jgi:hypothetical protein